MNNGFGFILSCLVSGGLLLQFACTKPDVSLAAAPPELFGESGEFDMKATLKLLDSLDSFPFNFTRSDLGVKLARKEMNQAKGKNEEEYLRGKFELAVQLTSAGYADSAAVVLNELNEIKEGSERYRNDKEVAETLIDANITASIRIGEQQNCQFNHNPQSCIMPFQGNAFHIYPQGSERAIEYINGMFKYQPNYRSLLWLLNFAYMTLDRYPQDVPQQYFIDFNKYDSNYPFPKFADIAAPLGVNTNGLLGGVCIEDFNNDGFLDIFNTSFYLSHNCRLYINNGMGGFEDKTEAAGLKGITAGVNAIHADYNNDGNTDIYIMRGGWMGQAGNRPNSLLENKGDGTFADVTHRAGLLAFQPSHTAAWADVNNDGWLDLFVGNEKGDIFEGPETKESDVPDNYSQLYVNNCNGTFTDISRDSGINLNKWVKGAVFTDFDNDGWPDLYISCFGQPNLLYKNLGADSLGAVRFSDVAVQAGVDQPVRSFPVAAFDFNNDGWEDLFVPGYDCYDVDLASEYMGGEPPHPIYLYLNNGDGTFSNRAVEAGINRSVYAMAMNYGDLDGDGFLDVYLATGYADLRALFPNIMLRNNQGIGFQDITHMGGFGHLQKGHAVAFGDLDNDGDEDIYLNVGGFFTGDNFWNILFENPIGAGNHISIRLEGVTSNKSGIGSRIKVVANMPGGGEQTIYRTVSTGGSYGASSLRQEIGLGNAVGIKSLEIRWPASGVVQQFGNVPANKYYYIRETDAQLTPKDLHAVKFKLDAKAHGGGHCHH